jgi:uncharacterized protein GlcG (DUF336 family)
MSESDLLQQRNLGIDLALAAAMGTLEAARSRGYRIAVAVSDRSGQILVLLRGDGGGVPIAPAMNWSARSASPVRRAPFMTRNAQTPAPRASRPACDRRAGRASRRRIKRWE